LERGVWVTLSAEMGGGKQPQKKKGTKKGVVRIGGELTTVFPFSSDGLKSRGEEGGREVISTEQGKGRRQRGGKRRMRSCFQRSTSERPRKRGLTAPNKGFEKKSSNFRIGARELLR